ncbi:MAG: hypothetical protein ISN28_08320 [Ectothiorhodospiraceae bacterium AqS1]|nr:hypothetical protein [Ectothiorhodospiraceae bacterium AqS1]
MNDISKTEDEKEAELENFLRWYEENECQVMAYLNDLYPHCVESERDNLERRVSEIRFNLRWIRKYRKIEEIKAGIDHSKDILKMSDEFVKELSERSPMHPSK